jgi:hypothetical protein
MAKTKQLLVPVRFKGAGAGGILHDTDYARGATDRAEAQRINDELTREHGDARWGVDYVMEPVEPFRAELRVVEHYKAGSSAYLMLVDREGRRWPMFLGDYVDIAATATVEHGWIEPLVYEVCKKGKAYGIKLSIG